MKLEKTQWVLVALTAFFVTFTLAFFIGRNSIHAVITTQSTTDDTPPQITETAPQEDIPQEPAPPAEEPEPPIEEPMRVNLNTATASELEELPGIGPKLAQRIILWREENGCFVSVEQLQDVDGIAEGKYNEIKDLIYVEAVE